MQILNKILKPAVNIFIKIFPLLAGLFIFLTWLAPTDWDVNYEIDGSWIYALAKLPSLGMSLGKEAWFPYGPIAHWFVQPLGLEAAQPIPYYLLGLFVAGLIWFCLKRCLDNTGGLVLRAVISILFLYSLFELANVQECYLTMAALMTFTAGYCFDRTRAWWIYCLMVLSIIGLLYKFSFGMLATAGLLIALAHAKITDALSSRHVIFLIVLYLAALFALFTITSGSTDIIRYFRLEMEISDKYSEIMSSHRPFMPFQYSFALLYAAAGIVFGLVASSRLPKITAIAFLASLSVIIFLLFKHGHVRLDNWHIALFYGNLASLNLILIMLAISNARSDLSKKRVYFVIILAITIMFAASFAHENPAFKDRPVVRNLTKSINKAGMVIKGGHPSGTAEKSALLKLRYEPLFSFLGSECSDIAATGKRPTITFYPWQLMFAEAADGCTLSPAPGLQICTPGPHSRLQQLEAEFLSSDKRPEIIVIGEQSLDGRNSVSEYTDLLAVLYRYYEITASINTPVNNFVVLKRSKLPIKDSEVLVCKEEEGKDAAFIFFLKQEELPAYHDAIWHMTKFLFKAPEMVVLLSGIDRGGLPAIYAFRAFHSQLSKGVYLSQDNIVAVIQRSFRWSEEHSNSSYKDSALSMYKSFDLRGVSASVRRMEGLHNLPVVPSESALSVKYCTFRKE
jgi:hypothetical protein